MWFVVLWYHEDVALRQRYVNMAVEFFEIRNNA